MTHHACRRTHAHVKMHKNLIWNNKVVLWSIIYSEWMLFALTLVWAFSGWPLAPRGTVQHYKVSSGPDMDYSQCCEGKGTWKKKKKLICATSDSYEYTLPSLKADVGQSKLQMWLYRFTSHWPTSAKDSFPSWIKLNLLANHSILIIFISSTAVKLFFGGGLDCERWHKSQMSLSVKIKRRSARFHRQSWKICAEV